MRALIIGSADLKYDGGGERNAVQIAEILMRMGYDVTLMGSGYPFIRKNNVNVKFNYIENAFSDDIFSNRHLMKLTNGISMGFIGLFSFNKIWEKIKGYDLYYFVTPNFIFRNAVKKFARLDKPPAVILANHGSYFEILDNHKFFGNLIKYILNIMIFSGITGKISVQAQNIYQKNFYINQNFKDVYLIPQNNIDFNKYKIEDHDGFNVVFLNKITKNKGSKLLFKIIKHAPKDIHFDIIGYGNMNKLRKKFKNYNVTFHGFVDENTKIEILARSDVMINLSKYESLSITSIEGLASGLYIIAPKISGLEYIKSMTEYMSIVKRNYISYINEIKRIKNFYGDNFINIRNQIKNNALSIFNYSVIEKNIENMVNDTLKKKEIRSYTIVYTVNNADKFRCNLNNLLNYIKNENIPVNEIMVFNNTKYRIEAMDNIRIYNKKSPYTGTEELNLISHAKSDYIIKFNDKNDINNIKELIKYIDSGYDVIVGSRFINGKIRSIKDAFDLIVIKFTHLIFPGITKVDDILSDFFVINRKIIGENKKVPDVYKALLYVLASTRTRNIKMVKTSSLSCKRIIMDEKSFYYYMTEIVVCMRAYHKRKPDKNHDYTPI